MEAIAKIQSHPADATVRVCRGKIDINTVPAHQGDVYLWRVAANHPRGDRWGSRQVAVGTTQGSRHVVEGDAVEVFAGKKLPSPMKVPANLVSAFLGPVVVAEAPFMLTHPEHAHHRLPAGTYQCTYQLDQRTQQRVKD